MLRIRRLAAAVAITLSTQIHAADFSSAVFFGDSLTDAGTYVGQPAIAGIYPIAGKFTTNPGSVWSEIVAAKLGHPTAPASQGGSNYAAGGARVDTQPGYPNNPLVPFIQTAPSIDDQISAYLSASGGRADGNALYAVWAGANDVFALQDGDVAYGALPMAQVADHLVAQIARLKNAGARYIVVANLPDIGTTPDAIAEGPATQAEATRYAQTFNRQLYAQLAAQGMRVIPIDSYGLLHQIMNDAALFGFTDIDSPACQGVPTSLVCTNANYAAGANQTHIFADGVHPTTAIHQTLADYVLSVLIAPQQVAMLADNSIATRSAWHDQLRAQLIGGVRARQATGRNIWLSVQGRRLDRDNGQIAPGYDDSGYQFALGADVQLNAEFVAGAALSLTNSNADYANERGDFTQREVALSAYGAWQRNAWFARGALAYGTIDYSLDRRVPLDIAAYTAAGDTDGRDFSAQLEGGYEWTVDRLATGPLLGVLAQELRIDSFDERGAGVINLGYATQRRHSLVGSAGWQVVYRAQSFQPYARISIDREFDDNEHNVTVSALSVAAALPFTLPVEGPGRTRYTAQLGMSGELPGGAHFNIGATQHFAQDDQRELQVFGGIAVAY